MLFTLQSYVSDVKQINQRDWLKIKANLTTCLIQIKIICCERQRRENSWLNTSHVIYKQSLGWVKNEDVLRMNVD